MNVTRADRHRLEAIVLDRSAPQKHVWRANIILAGKRPLTMKMIWRLHRGLGIPAKYTHQGGGSKQLNGQDHG